jgi:epoxyqueuosine reductase
MLGNCIVESGNFLTGLYCKHKTVSTNHLQELQEDIDKLKNEGKLSENATYRNYLKDFKFKNPEELPDAKSLIILAVPMRLVRTRFHLKGKTYDVTFPSNYCGDGLTEEDLKRLVRQVTREPKLRIERTWDHLPLKLLAVRSGLGKYGRNNLCYVGEMGSLLRLFGYFTNCKLEDNWNKVAMMQACKNCKACMMNCPNHCISEGNLVIDAGSCVTLYNETEGEFPEWIAPTAHNSLMGCMRCQSVCPANRNALASVRRLEDINEEETRKILDGEPDQELLNSLSRKLCNIYPTRSVKYFQILTRNLRVLLNVNS